MLINQLLNLHDKLFMFLGAGPNNCSNSNLKLLVVMFFGFLERLKRIWIEYLLGNLKRFKSCNHEPNVINVSINNLKTVGTNFKLKTLESINCL